MNATCNLMIQIGIISYFAKDKIVLSFHNGLLHLHEFFENFLGFGAGDVLGTTTSVALKILRIFRNFAALRVVTLLLRILGAIGFGASNLYEVFIFNFNRFGAGVENGCLRSQARDEALRWLGSS